MSETTTYHVFRVEAFVTFDGKNSMMWKYVRIDRAGYGSQGADVRLVDKIEDATQYHPDKINDVIQAFHNIQAYCRHGEKIQFNTVTVERKFDSIDLNDPVYLDERRRRAFVKLNQEDVEVLGLEKLAAYNKLKYHKPDE
jgi:hypothetical protein